MRNHNIKNNNFLLLSIFTFVLILSSLPLDEIYAYECVAIYDYGDNRAKCVDLKKLGYQKTKEEKDLTNNDVSDEKRGESSKDRLMKKVEELKRAKK